MIFKTPTHYFLASGHSEGFSPLNAFDQALLNAGVGDTNLVRMSSILPPHCQRVDPFQPPGGALVPVAYSQIQSSTPGVVIAAAVAIGLPEDPALPGCIMEYHAAAPLSDVLATVHEMALQGMAFRDRPVADVLLLGAEHRVEHHGAAFAGVVLWDGLGR